jgi:hypothetical protein
MKKSKLLVLGLIALLLTGGLILASCDIFKCREYGQCITNSAGYIRCENSSCAVEEKIAKDGTGTSPTVKCDC